MVDAETGFVYLRARYYNPATGQFIKRDPLTALTGQPYSYADNNRLNYIDPRVLQLAFRSEHRPQEHQFRCSRHRNRGNRQSRGASQPHDWSKRDVSGRPTGPTRNCEVSPSPRPRQTAGKRLRRFTLDHIRQLDKALADVQRRAFEAAGVREAVLDVDSTYVFSRSKRLCASRRKRRPCVASLPAPRHTRSPGVKGGPKGQREQERSGGLAACP